MRLATGVALSVQQVDTVDLPELSTLFARSFHPNSPYMRQAIPDTPITRAWWTKTNEYALRDPQVRLYKAVDLNTGYIVAACRWRVSDLDAHDELDAGTWSNVPLSDDHDHFLCAAFIEFMAQQRSIIMKGRSHILIELLMTAHKAKGMGAGTMLVMALLEEADSARLPVFVETNGGVVSFYRQLGFNVIQQAVMPGGEYVEYSMVRETRKEG